MYRWFLLGFLWSALNLDAKDRPPNFVVILADDMGYGDATCYNPKSKSPTPNIDRLAREGMRFTDAHSPASWCVPTRYGMLTGRYPHRADMDWRRKAVIEDGRTTVGSALREQGYSTAMVGKWHLGFDGGPDYDYTKPLIGGPLDRGFDFYYGMSHSLDIVPYYYISGRRAVKVPNQQIGPRNTEGWSPIQGEFWRGGPISPDFKHVEVLPRFTEQSVDYLRSRRDKANPFFLYVALPAPHTPWLPTKKFRNRTNNMYTDFVAMVDDTVGQILKALDENGLARDTLVLFTSDNGPVWYESDTQRFGHSATTPLRGMKGDAWEGGHRMPFIVRWPNAVKAGSVSDALVCQTDLLATFAAIADRKLADDEGEDSENLLPVLTGRREEGRFEMVTLSSRKVLGARRGGWKYMNTLSSGGFTKVQLAKPKPGDPKGQLYNLSNDIGETENRWNDAPSVVKEFETMIASQKESGRSRPRMQAFAHTIQKSKSIRTWRLDPDGENGTFGDYAIGAPGKPLAGKASAALRRLLLADADASTRHDEKFHFNPGILLRFQSGKDEVQVAICFICNKWALYLNGETVSYTSIEEERLALLAEVKAIFPNDKIIQGIPEKLQ